jgi:hypothetical protein
VEVREECEARRGAKKKRLKRIFKNFIPLPSSWAQTKNYGVEFTGKAPFLCSTMKRDKIIRLMFTHDAHTYVEGFSRLIFLLRELFMAGAARYQPTMCAVSVS